MKRLVALFLLLPLLLLMTACPSAQDDVTLGLYAISAAAAVAPPVIMGMVVDGVITQSTADITLNYVAAVSQADSASIVEWQSKDTLPVKVAAITTNFAAAIAPNIPGAPPGLEAAIRAIAAAVQALLAILPQPPAMMAKAGVTAKPLTRADKHALSEAKKQSDSTLAYCRAHIK